MWGPGVSVVTVAVASPLVSGTAEPRLEPPSLNCTVPVGVPTPGAVAVTVAVRPTLWPYVEGLTDDPTATEVSAWLTTWVAGAETLGLKSASPA